MKNFKIDINQNKQFGGKEIVIETNVDGENQKQTNNLFVKLIMGVIIGFVNGFWGGGGGMICVPLLMQVIKLPEKNAHATTLLIMLPLSLSSLLIYILKGSMLWLDAIKISIGFVVGGVIGALALKKISNVWLGIVFSLIIIAGGVKMLLWIYFI